MGNGFELARASEVAVGIVIAAVVCFGLWRGYEAIQQLRAARTVAEAEAEQARLLADEIEAQRLVRSWVKRDLLKHAFEIGDDGRARHLDVSQDPLRGSPEERAAWLDYYRVGPECRGPESTTSWTEAQKADCGDRYA